ncbi:MAG: hypothetical protein IJU45_08105 [Clostridia bacterium]|nr:hypothetical protein [Clostridia bacterium]
METEDMIYIIGSRHTTELDPQNKISGSEADLYKTTENDDCDFTQNTTSQD